MGSVELRTEECVSSLGDKTATDLCREAEPEAFCGFLKPLCRDNPVLSFWNRASPREEPAGSMSGSYQPEPHSCVGVQGSLSTALCLTGS